MVEIAKFSRFSMCNCLTVRMDRHAKTTYKKKLLRTYTAHLMTPSVFINEAYPGTIIDVPFKSYWPRAKHIRQYYIPQKIKTFLLSTFNEVFHPNYTFGTSTRYTVPFKYRKAVLKHKLSKRDNVKAKNLIDKKTYIKHLKQLDAKVDEIWGPVNKILILYDHSAAPSEIQHRANKFNKIARKTLDWPCIPVEETYARGNRTWQHYATNTYLKLLVQIEQLERKGI